MTQKILAIQPRYSPQVFPNLIERLQQLFPGNQVLSAGNGEETLGIVQKEQPDVILLGDTVLDKEGPSLCQQLKTSEFTKHIPVIMITEKENEPHTLSSGDTAVRPDIFLNKKTGDRELETHLKLLLRLKKTEDQLHRMGAQLELKSCTDMEQHKNEEKYRELIDNCSDAIYLRYNRNFEFINKQFQEMFKVTLEEVSQPGFDFINLVSPKSRDLIEERERKLERGEYVEPKYEFIALSRDGREMEMEASVTRIKYKDGYAIQGVVRDISKRKQWEKRMRQARKIEALSTLASGIAHQFNNILAIIRGYTELSLDSLTEESVLSRNLQQVLDASDRARGLVNQILIFSQQAREGQRALEISSVIKASLQLLQSSWPSNIELRQDIQSNAGFVLADPSQIRQLIVNFCTNAFYAIGNQKGVIEISLKKIEIGEESIGDLKNLEPGPYLKLTVKDSGHGIEHKVKERIFDPFFTTRHTGEGTGMGLAVILGIIKTCGGDIQVESEPGKGTGFHLFFPCLNIEEKPREISHFHAALPITSPSERLLFVDDEKMLVEVQQQMLERLGYHVITATSAPEALDLFSADPEIFDLVITDHAMPGMTGIDLTRKILDIRPDVPVILCTGLTKATIHQEAKAAGIAELIMKPIIMKDLAGLIREVLDKHYKDQKPGARNKEE